MARIEWVRLRLENWALWVARESAGGLGFSTQSVLLADASGRDGYREAILPVDEVDASLTDQAVASLKGPRGHLHSTLVLIYVKDAGTKGAAKVECCAESTISARLCEADRALRNWFSARQELQAQQKINYLNRSTT